MYASLDMTLNLQAFKKLLAAPELFRVVGFSHFSISFYFPFSFSLSRASCKELDWGAIGHTSKGGGAFYYIGLAGLAVQGKDNSLDLHLLPMVTNP
jgi:hypothetical protein